MLFMMNNLQDLVVDGNFEIMSYWAFSDIFEELGFHSEPFNNQFGMQTIRGIPKPIFRVFELVYELGSEIAYQTTRTDGDNNEGTITTFCLRNKNDNNRYGVFMANWNFYVPPSDPPTIHPQTIELTIKQNGIPKNIQLYRIDANNTNPMYVYTYAFIFFIFYAFKILTNK